MWPKHSVGREVISEVRSDRAMVCDMEMVRFQTPYHQDLPIRTNFQRFFGGDPMIGEIKPMEVPKQGGQSIIYVRHTVIISVRDHPDEAMRLSDR